MQVVDSLQLGGMESVAVNYANELSRRGFKSCLCPTRAPGPLQERLVGTLPHLDLRRRGRVDLAALRRMVAYIKKNRVDILHAHGTAIFFSALARFSNI